MTKFKCKKCGCCCKLIILGTSLSLKQLEQSYFLSSLMYKMKNNRRGKFVDRCKKKLGFNPWISEIHIVYPMLVQIGYDRSRKEYVYTCKHYIGGKCSIHKFKPYMCSSYNCIKDKKNAPEKFIHAYYRKITRRTK